eukprot:gnl/Ergobibamus_cyprinoides/441.p2 GENE.gnl/Ergobibamus_cyprinoides/441~~gnl/Ergobibamus_cyprinoides/441.p2  ORF type:complete len:114 (+),score=21.06 gnl/Ergobibamus_cyprinoides/441:605-946(+)
MRALDLPQMPVAVQMPVAAPVVTPSLHSSLISALASVPTLLDSALRRVRAYSEWRDQRARESSDFDAWTARRQTHVAAVRAAREFAASVEDFSVAAMLYENRKNGRDAWFETK